MWSKHLNGHSQNLPFMFGVWCQLIETMEAVIFSQGRCPTDVPVFIKEQCLSPLAPGAVLPPKCQPSNGNSCYQTLSANPGSVWIPMVHAKERRRSHLGKGSLRPAWITKSSHVYAVVSSTAVVLQVVLQYDMTPPCSRRE